MEVTQRVDGRTHAIRTRTDDVVFTLLLHGQMEAMLFTPKMVVYAAMGLFHGGSAQSSKTVENETRNEAAVEGEPGCMVAAEADTTPMSAKRSYC